MKNSEIISKVTDRIIKIMESGEIPWNKPWDGGFSMPKNGKTGKAYKGGNLYLSFLPYAKQDYYTFSQIKSMGESIKKGEEGLPIVYWSVVTSKECDEEGKPITFPVLRYYFVWNIAQTTITLPEEPQEKPRIQSGEEILNGYTDKPSIMYGGDKAVYYPTQDKIVCPDLKAFHETEEFYSTLFHELVHSTGHESRLKRDLSGNFGNSSYSKEELIAELGSSFLCGIAGFTSRCRETNHAAYLKGWLKKLKEDKKLFFDAVKFASKAVDFIITGKQETTVTEGE